MPGPLTLVRDLATADAADARRAAEAARALLDAVKVERATLAARMSEVSADLSAWSPSTGPISPAELLAASSAADSLRVDLASLRVRDQGLAAREAAASSALARALAFANQAALHERAVDGRLARADARAAAARRDREDDELREVRR